MSIDDPLHDLVKVSFDLYQKPYQVAWDATLFGVYNDDSLLFIDYNDAQQIILGNQCLSITILQFWRT